MSICGNSQRMFRLSILRHFTRGNTPFTQRPLLPPPTSRQISTSHPLRSTNQPSQRAEELCRACGAPMNSTEAGPKFPSGILRPEVWIMGAAAVLTMGGLYLFLPNKATDSGQATQTKILQERKALERREGDRETEETEAQKAEEAELIKEARAAREIAKQRR